MPEELFWGHKTSNLTLIFEDNSGWISEQNVSENIGGADNTRGQGLCQSRRFSELGRLKVNVETFLKASFLKIDYKDGPCQNNTLGVAVLM